MNKVKNVGSLDLVVVVFWNPTGFAASF